MGMAYEFTRSIVKGASASPQRPSVGAAAPVGNLWFKRIINDDFSVKDKERQDRSSKFEHQQLQALLDEDSYQF